MVNLTTGAPNHEPSPLCWEGAGELDEVDAAALRAALHAEGCVVLRGFGSSVRQFRDLIGRLGTRVVTDPDVTARAPHPEDQQVQTVVSGDKPIGLHYEFGHLPWRPALVAFWCERAASLGGETVVCNTARLWRDLPASDRALLEEHGIEHRGVFPEEAVRQYLAPILGECDLDQVIASTPPDAPLRLERIDDHEVRAFHRVSTTAVDSRTGAKRLATNVFPRVYSATEHLLGNGSPIPEDVMGRLLAVAAAVQVPVRWSDGDVVLVDNARWMHGRLPFRGERRVFTLQAHWAS